MPPTDISTVLFMVFNLHTTMTGKQAAMPSRTAVTTLPRNGDATFIVKLEADSFQAR